MRKIRLLLLTLLVTLSLTLTGCDLFGKKDDQSGRVTLDINPSFEIILNDEGLVASVNALNDDAILVTVDLDFSGKTIEQVVDLLVSEATELGFLDKSTEEGENTVSISSSSDDTTWANELYEKVKTQVSTTLSEYGITEDIKKIASQSVEEIKAYLSSQYNVVIDSAKATYADCLEALNEQREKYNEFYNTEYQSLYAESEEYYSAYYACEDTLNYLNEAVNDKSAVKAVVSAFTATAQIALEAYKTAIDAFISTYKSVYVSASSAYQTALSTILEKKQALAKLRNDSTTESAALDAAELLLTQAETALETAKQTADTAVQAAKSAITTANEAIVNANNSIINELKNNSIINLIFTLNETELNEYVENKAHDYYSSVVTEEFKTEAQAYLNALTQKKISIKANINITVGE